MKIIKLILLFIQALSVTLILLASYITIPLVFILPPGPWIHLVEWATNELESMKIKFDKIQSS